LRERKTVGSGRGTGSDINNQKPSLRVRLRLQPSAFLISRFPFKPLGIKDTGPTNLKLFRQFYLASREIGQTLSDFSGTLPGIGQTLSDESTPTGLRVDISPAVALSRPIPIGWSHYVEQLYLPSREELKARLEQITHNLEGGDPP